MKPILIYSERVNFLELRNTKIDGMDTFEIINWNYDNAEYEIIGYWSLNECYEFRQVENRFLKVDSIILNKYMRKAQIMLDCYLGEMRRFEMM